MHFINGNALCCTYMDKMESKNLSIMTCKCNVVQSCSDSWMVNLIPCIFHSNV